MNFQKLLCAGIQDDDGWLVKKLDVQVLKVDYSYQRYPKEACVKNLVQNFNSRYLGAFTVGKRADGTYFVLDGNHRKEALLRLLDMGELKSPLVRCEIMLDTTPRLEASIFIGKNTANKVNGVALYKACLMMREEPHMTIKAITEKYNFEVELLDAGKPSPRNGKGLRGAVTLLSAYKDAPDHFESGIKILSKVWKKDVEAHSGEFIKGITTFLKTQAGSYNTAMLNGFINRLKNTPASNGIKIAKEKGHSSARIKRLAEWISDVTGVGRKIAA